MFQIIFFGSLHLILNPFYIQCTIKTITLTKFRVYCTCINMATGVTDPVYLGSVLECTDVIFFSHDPYSSTFLMIILRLFCKIKSNNTSEWQIVWISQLLYIYCQMQIKLRKIFRARLSPLNIFIEQ